MGILLKKFGEEGIIEITKRLSMNYKTFFDEGFIYYTSPMFSLISSIICDLPYPFLKVTLVSFGTTKVLKWCRESAQTNAGKRKL